MILSPRLSASATLSGLSGGVLSFGVVPDDIVTALTPFFVGDPGPQGDSWARTFETVSQNLEGYPFSITRVDGSISSIVYDLGGGQAITKTLGRSGGVVTTITLSGDTPAGIDLVKTLTRSDGAIVGVSYGSA